MTAWIFQLIGLLVVIGGAFVTGVAVGGELHEK
ncbi:unnamed protein product [Fructobacillus fructosus]|uniref:Uncharacterized protein n=1 Tax=Fructobacillus fructosus TaxID=1631 RepID=A0ABN9YR49_9LACO|nr:unnamed protein product [Fructobacillus fructosus]CAK1252198.1 unnamed protein product [Fructobacillus fructosus]